MAKHLNDFGLKMTEDILGAPMPLIERNVRWALIDFCEFTFTWRQSLDPMSLVAGQNEYQLTVPAESRVVTVLYAGDSGLKIVPTTMRTLDTSNAVWRGNAVDKRAEQAQWYYLPDRTKIRIVLTPFKAKTDALDIMVALKPTQDAKQVPDFLYEDNLEDIKHGALSKILAIPKKEWTDAPMASYHLKEFEQAKRREKAERYNDYTRQSTLSVLPTNYTGTNRRGRYDGDDC